MSDNRQIVCLYPWLAMGGADKFNHDMLAGLAERGWRATIVTTRPSPHPWRAAFEELTDEIVDLTTYSPADYPEQLLRIIRTRAADCLFISHSQLGYDLLPFLRAQMPELVYVDYCHLVDPNTRGGYPYMSLSRAGTLDLQIVSSQALKRWMCERGGASERIAVCTTNIDADVWNPARYDRKALRASLQIPEDARVVMYAARLERQKQPLLALSVLREMLAALPNTYALIAGDGSFAGYLRRRLRHNGLQGRVRMLGATSNQRVRELLAASDLFFLPSQAEGISLAIYEAMAMRVVPISAAVGGQAELVTPDCGVLVERGPDERAAYIAALERLLCEPELANRMGQAARQRVCEEFRLEQMSMRLSGLLEQARLLHQARPRKPIDAATGYASARAAVAGAQRHTVATARRHLRELYWNVASHGPYWLLPFVERMRSSKGV
jgi:glycosyltransferase involved in cell wall biosynthesis